MQQRVENFVFDYCAPECGIRETRRIEGEKNITGQDYISGKFWNDSVCYSFYPIDIHDSKGDGVDICPLKKGIIPTIPLGSMIPHNSQNFLVAGRAISGNEIASSAYRIQPSCMAMGQAAGATAAISIEKNIKIKDVKINDIYNLLEKYDAIIPKNK